LKVVIIVFTANFSFSLKARHIQFIALGGTIGTGLFLGIGGAFAQAGPLAVLLGYTFTGIAVFAMMQSLGEMATWLPLPGAIPQYCARYVDPALGFAVGWNYWYSCAITLCAEISAASLVIAYWKPDQGSLVAVWITLIIILIICLNIFAVRIYGEAEFAFASVKILTIVGLLIMAFILDLGGGPNHQRLGFHYWKHPGPIKQYPPQVGGATGRFLAFFSTLVQASFSYGGVEMVAIAAGEAENPLKNIPKAVRRVFWRILFFYVLGSLAIGVLVSSDDPDLTSSKPGKLCRGNLTKSNTYASQVLLLRHGSLPSNVPVSRVWTALSMLSFSLLLLHQLMLSCTLVPDTSSVSLRTTKLQRFSSSVPSMVFQSTLLPLQLLSPFSHTWLSPVAQRLSLDGSRISSPLPSFSLGFQFALHTSDSDQLSLLKMSTATH
jgi:amino acid transporter